MRQETAQNARTRSSTRVDAIIKIACESIGHFNLEEVWGLIIILLEIANLLALLQTWPALKAVVSIHYCLVLLM